MQPLVPPVEPLYMLPSIEHLLAPFPAAAMQQLLHATQPLHGLDQLLAPMQPLQALPSMQLDQQQQQQAAMDDEAAPHLDAVAAWLCMRSTALTLLPTLMQLEGRTETLAICMAIDLSPSTGDFFVRWTGIKTLPELAARAAAEGVRLDEQQLGHIAARMRPGFAACVFLHGNGYVVMELPISDVMRQVLEQYGVPRDQVSVARVMDVMREPATCKEEFKARMTAALPRMAAERHAAEQARARGAMAG